METFIIIWSHPLILAPAVVFLVLFLIWGVFDEIRDWVMFPFDLIKSVRWWLKDRKEQRSDAELARLQDEARK